MRTLVIDGNFLAKRILGVSDLDFMSDVEEDRRKLLIMLCTHLSAEVKRNKGVIDNIVFCRDSKSWRKSIDIVKRLDEIVDDIDTEQDYKANRKPDSRINNTEFWQVIDEFFETIATNFSIPMTKIFGSEGDDAIWAWTRFLNSQKKKSLIYCTDSDLNQLVIGSVMVFRHIKSKDAPSGQIVVDKSYYDLYTKTSTPPKNLIDAFSYDPTIWSSDKLLIGSRTIDSGLKVYYPAFGVLKQMIIGATKDNIPGIFVWKASTGTRTFHISEKHLLKSLDDLSLNFTDITHNHLYDEEFLRNLLVEVIKVTKQTSNTNIDIDHCMKMMTCNRKLAYLHPKEIPSEVIDALKANIEAQSHLVADLKGLEDPNALMSYLHVSNDRMFTAMGV